MPKLADKPLAESQLRLLDLAFETASAIPLDPHVKDRCKAQEAVVLACLELDQPRRACELLKQIADWRRGACYAGLAEYCAQRGQSAAARQYLERAAAEAESAEDWRRDRIRMKIARTYALPGQDDLAADFAAGTDDSESGAQTGASPLSGTIPSVPHLDARGGDEDFDAQLREVEALIATENFDARKNALAACAQLFDRHYENEERRERAEATIKASWSKLPAFVRIELLTQMAGFALEHRDAVTALKLTNEAREMLDGFNWPLEYRLSQLAQLAGLRHRAGDTERARGEADAALALYRSEGEQIVNIYRAGALRPLAQAYQTMNDRAAALAVFKLAVEAGVENPNSRPRAEDLSATCWSMALCQAEPDAELWARIERIRGELGAPW